MRLRHVDCAGPGLQRRRNGNGFIYHHNDGRPIRDRETLARVRSLAIPPAWRDVWICSEHNGHLQAVGTDVAGRRQYLYHPEWRNKRDLRKFEQMLDFAGNLPALRRRVARFLRDDGLSERRVLACAVALLDRGLFRIGGDEYSAENGSHGLATLERRHVRLEGSRTLRFAYVGKAGKHLEHKITDSQISAAVSELKHLRRRSPRLLAYRDEDGWRDVHADDINRFIKQLTGADYSAKDFRTWHGTVLAALALARSEQRPSAAARKRAIRDALQEASDALGNTPAVCRASYIDPRVFDRYRTGNTIAAALPGNGREPGRPTLEAAVLDLLR